MAIGDLTLNDKRAMRVGAHDLYTISGSIDVGGTTVTAGVAVALASADGNIPSGRKISDFFDTVHDVTITPVYAAGVRATVASKFTQHEYDITNDKILVYTENATSGVTTVSNSETSVGTVNFVATGRARGN